VRHACACWAVSVTRHNYALVGGSSYQDRAPIWQGARVAVDRDGRRSRQDRWATTQMRRSVLSAVISKASPAVARVRRGFVSEGRQRGSPTGGFALGPPKADHHDSTSTLGRHHNGKLFRDPTSHSDHAVQTSDHERDGGVRVHTVA